MSISKYSTDNYIQAAYIYYIDSIYILYIRISQVSIQLQTQTKAAPQPSFTPVQTGLLQRNCACGQHTVAGGECEECRQKREGMLQRASVSAAPVNSVPPIVHDVLSSPGQALDTGTRAFMEPRFGHDFSQVRVHRVRGRQSLHRQ